MIGEQVNEVVKRKMRKLVLEIDDGYADAIGMTFIGGAGCDVINIYSTTVNLTDKELTKVKLVNEDGKARMILIRGE